MPEQRKPNFIVLQSVRSDIRKNRPMFQQTHGLLDPSTNPCAIEARATRCDRFRRFRKVCNIAQDAYKNDCFTESCPSVEMMAYLTASTDAKLKH